MIDPREFRRTLGRFATGITVVTMRSGDRIHGITVNAFMAASLEPPLIALCIDKRARAHATLSASERFGVSILRAEQTGSSDRFAGRAGPSEADPFEDFHGFPVLHGALGKMVCSVYDVTDAGDHSLFLGEVEALGAFEGRPLLYFEGRYVLPHDLQRHESSDVPRGPDPPTR